MTPKKEAENLINEYRIILMNENTECGNEILCTSIAKQCALVTVDELIEQERKTDNYYEIGSYWQEVKQQINKI